MEQLDLIEEITRNDGSRYYEISNIDRNGISEPCRPWFYIESVKNIAAKHSVLPH